MPNISTRPTQLPEELGMYLDQLRKEYSSLDEVWLLGPRINEENPRGTEWDLLAFADTDALAALRADKKCHREDLNFMVVVDGDRFESAWGQLAGERHAGGRLSDIQWRLEDPHTATYIVGANEAERETAVRVR